MRNTMRNRNINHTFYHNEVVIKCAIVCTILLHKMMMLASQEILVTLTHHLFNLKLQQTNFLIPKMLQIFILHIIIIILDFLTIENLLLQLFRISIVNHNFAVSRCANNAITINKDATHLAVNTPHDGLSYQNNANAHTTSSITKVFRITLIPNIVVNI